MHPCVALFGNTLSPRPCREVHDKKVVRLRVLESLNHSEESSISIGAFSKLQSCISLSLKLPER